MWCQSNGPQIIHTTTHVTMFWNRNNTWCLPHYRYFLMKTRTNKKVIEEQNTLEQAFKVRRWILSGPDALLVLRCFNCWRTSFSLIVIAGLQSTLPLWTRVSNIISWEAEKSNSSNFAKQIIYFNHIHSRPTNTDFFLLMADLTSLVTHVLLLEKKKCFRGLTDSTL